MSLEIDVDTVYERYMTEVNHIFEECDWKTTFTPRECVELVCQVLNKNPELIKSKDEKSSQQLFQFQVFQDLNRRFRTKLDAEPAVVRGQELFCKIFEPSNTTGP